MERPLRVGRVALARRAPDDWSGGGAHQAPHTLGWAAVHGRLIVERDDALAWNTVRRRVHVWAAQAFRQWGWHAVNDAVADTCSAVAVSIETARGGETFAGFVYGQFLTARRRMLLDRRRERVLVSLENLDCDVAAPCGDTAAAPAVDQAARVRRALDVLPVRQRRAIVMRYLDARSSTEIAAALGVTEEHARRIVSSGLARLRRHLRTPGPIVP